MVLSYRKSRMTLIALLALTAVLTVLILLFHESGFSGEKEILAVIVASLGAFISISVARLVMNSEILSLRYMLINAINLEKCAKELEAASKRMRKRSEDKFQTALQAADALSILGRSDEAIALLLSAAECNPTPEHATQFLLSALRYSILAKDGKGAVEYKEKLKTALKGLKGGIGKGLYEKEFKQFESFLDGEETLLIHRFRSADNTLIKLEAAMMLSGSENEELRKECIEFISKPKGIE